MAFSPDGKTLASGSFDNSVKLWDVSTGKNTATLAEHAEAVYCVAFSPDGKTLASAGGTASLGEIKLWDVAAGKLLADLPGHAKRVIAVAFSPDGAILASAGGENIVRLWDLATRKSIKTLEGHTDGVKCLAFSPDGKTLASGSRNNTIRLWKVAAAKEPAKPARPAVVVECPALVWSERKLLARTGAITAVAQEVEMKTPFALSSIPRQPAWLALTCLCLAFVATEVPVSCGPPVATWTTPQEKRRREALLAFHKGGSRKEFLATCKKLVAEDSGGRYDDEFKSLITSLEREAAAPRPAFLQKSPKDRTEEERIRYWIYQLRDLSADPAYGGGPPTIFGWDTARPTAANQIMAICAPAIPFLIDSLDDGTPTRTFVWHQPGRHPGLSMLRRQDIAINCLEWIVGCKFYESYTSTPLHVDTPERRSALANVREWWKLSQGKPQAEMIRNQLALRSKNITLRNWDKVGDLECWPC